MSIKVKSNLVLKRSFAFKVCELTFSNKNTLFAGSGSSLKPRSPNLTKKSKLDKEKNWDIMMITPNNNQ